MALGQEFCHPHLEDVAGEAGQYPNGKTSSRDYTLFQQNTSDLTICIPGKYTVHTKVLQLQACRLKLSFSDI